MFTTLDIDDARNADFKAELGFRAQPQWILLDAQGNVLQQWFGSVPEGVFAEAFDAALK